MDDFELLREYADCRSERAFTELVSRHLPLVYGTALRMLRQPSAAQDVAQNVFIQLARQAAKLRPAGSLPGWLYRATQRAALHALRAESRRRKRETTAMNLAEQNHDPATVWPQLAPLLDEAIGRLKPVEQDAVLMRYFDGCSLNETGRALSLSEAAAQKRVSRALEKMRQHFAKRGIVLSTALLATTLDAGAQPPVPPGLAAAVSLNAITPAALKTTLTLISLKTMITSTLGVALASVVAVGGIAAAVVTYDNAVADFSAPAYAPVAAVAPAGQASSDSAPASDWETSNAVDSGTAMQASTPADVPPAPPPPTKMVVGTGTGVGGALIRRLVAVGGGMGGGMGPAHRAEDASALYGAPIYSTVNDDGSTTNTYMGPDSETIEMTVWPNGNTISIRVWKS